MTRKDRLGGPTGHGPLLSRRRPVAGKSAAGSSGGLGRSGDVSQSDPIESMPARKASLPSSCGARTANRHWWAAVSTVR